MNNKDIGANKTSANGMIHKPLQAVCQMYTEMNVEPLIIIILKRNMQKYGAWDNAKLFWVMLVNDMPTAPSSVL